MHVSVLCSRARLTPLAWTFCSLFSVKLWANSADLHSLVSRVLFTCLWQTSIIFSCSATRHRFNRLNLTGSSCFSSNGETSRAGPNLARQAQRSSSICSFRDRLKRLTSDLWADAYQPRRRSVTFGAMDWKSMRETNWPVPTVCWAEVWAS